MNKNDAERMIQEISELQKKIQQAHEDSERLIKGLESKRDLEIDKNNAVIQKRLDSLLDFFRANKILATGKKDKKIELKNGDLILYAGKLSAVFKNQKTAIEVLKAFELGRFIKVTETIDKSAIIADPRAVKGVEGIDVVKVKRFGVKPKQGKLESKIIRKEKIRRLWAKTKSQQELTEG